MDSDIRQDLQRLNERVGGMNAAVETGFATIRRDVHYLSRAYLPALILAGVALVLSISSLFIAMDNRSLILTVSAQTSKNARDLENIIPIVFQPYTPTPPADESPQK